MRMVSLEIEKLVFDLSIYRTCFWLEIENTVRRNRRLLRGLLPITMVI